MRKIFISFSFVLALFAMSFIPVSKKETKKEKLCWHAQSSSTQYINEWIYYSEYYMFMMGMTGITHDIGCCDDFCYVECATVCGWGNSPSIQAADVVTNVQRVDIGPGYKDNAKRIGDIILKANGRVTDCRLVEDKYIEVSYLTPSK